MRRLPRRWLCNTRHIWRLGRSPCVGMGEGLAGQLLAYQANKPILDQLLKEAGFEGENAVSSLLAGLQPDQGPKASD